MRKRNYYKDNYENCYNAALECSSRGEFCKRYPAAYKESLNVRENGKRWIDDYYWFVRPKQHNIIWKDNYEAVYQEALKYQTKTEFAKNSGGAYQEAIKVRENGKRWIDDYYWFKQDLDVYINKKDNIYAYFFVEFNSVYVGRSINPHRRDNSHRNNKKKSTVYEFAETHNIPIPEMTILETNLPPNEGQEREDYYVKKFKVEGWNVLNKAKTGAGTGSLGAAAKKNTKTKVLRTAEKYKTMTEFRKNHPSMYGSAWENGWLKELTWLEKDLTNKPKAVVEISNGKAIQLFSSNQEAANKTGLKQGNISACLRGKQKQTGGKQFMSLNTYLDNLMEQLRIECENIKSNTKVA